MNIKDIYNKVFSGEKSSVILIVIVTLLLFVLIIISLIFSIKNGKLKGKMIQDQPIKLDTITSPVILTGNDIPTCQVGREYTFSFWIYLEDYQQTASISPYKLIFFRGDSTSLKSANPIIFMDPISNKMYFAIKTQSSVIPDTEPINLTQTSNTNNSVNDQLTRLIKSNYFLNNNLSLDPSKTTPMPNTHIIIAVDYVPLQRWVNFQIVIDNKLITIHMDGEIYSVKTTDEVKSMRQPEFDTLNNNQQLNYNLIIDKTTGDVSLGPTSFNNTTISGYLSNLQFFNYSVSTPDIFNIYKNGPFSTNILSKFGISNPYRLRNPVYKLI